MLYIIIFIGVIIAGLVKYAQKRELSGKLGREVDDHELVSLNSWIEAEQKEDRRKKIKPENVSIPKNEKKVVKPQKETIQNLQTVETNIEKQIDTPNNCENCGAALSKEIAFCQFCGTHSSRKSLEEQTSIFLHNLDKDFDLIIPASHEQLRLGCFLIPLLALTGAAAVYFFLPSMNFKNALVFGIPIISPIVGYIWLNVTDHILTKKEAAIFDRKLEPKIRQFMKGSNLQDLELLNIAKRNFNEHNKLLKHIYRRF
ncbi:MAG: zinc ribbon domain-containing protein [Pyrinomonadaceae bacterium]|nr:zinc ribbon domain-containing protein [Pyrinomonadaceae bacterium]